LRSRADRLSGILNGVDYSEWNPERDRFIAARYSTAEMAGKEICKRALKDRLGIRQDGVRRPLFGMVSRLAQQKGIELLLEVLPQILKRDVDVALLGSGDPGHEAALFGLRSRFGDRVGTYVGFDNALSHMVEAGSDFFLMPSVYEPCGLNQMYSLRYGTPPIVHATGGLDDTVVDASLPEGNGFKFMDYRDAAFLWAVDRARQIYDAPESLEALRRRGMRADFSWDVAAANYVALYERTLAARPRMSLA
jgi:starch synthase